MNPIRDEWQSDDGSVRLILGDCLEILPTLSGIDAVVTDPPYGIGEDGGLKARYRHGDGRTRGVVKHEAMGWDSERPPKKAFDLLLNVAPIVFIFGGNYFADILPPSAGWLYWHKNIGGDFADGELIYSNRKGALRSFSIHPFAGLHGGKDRVHPTQKPVDVMLWCLSFAPNGLICDPFMGSGTTGVACVRTGRRFVGVEICEKYWEIAVRRVRAELERFPLFEQSEASLRQLELPG